MKRGLAAGALLSLACLSVPVPTLAVDRLDEIFARGNEAFLTGDYAAAIAEYEALVAAGVSDPDVYFNLGLSHARADELGRAVLAFERCLRHRPSDSEARTALRGAQTLLARRQADRDGEATMNTDTSILEASYRWVSLELLSITALSCWNLFFLLLLIVPYVRRESGRLTVSVGAVISGLLAAVMLLGVSVKHDFFLDGSPAVYVADSAPLLQGPDRRTSSAGQIAEGDRCRFLREEGDYAEVQSSSGVTGWTLRDRVEPIGR